jgi:peptidoglycan/LPS O-acetylase OafA/YrhL
VRLRAAALAANAVTALAVALLPWFALDDYEPNGWDATWFARGAAAAALASMVLLRVRRDARPAAAAAAIALVLVAIRVAVPPDFGFGFDGLRVPVERQVGCWVALASSVLALLASLALVRREPSPQAPPPPEPSSAAAAP